MVMRRMLRWKVMARMREDRVTVTLTVIVNVTIFLLDCVVSRAVAAAAVAVAAVVVDGVV